MRLFFTLASFIILSACSHKPYSVQTSDKDKLSPMHTVYVLSHGWHTAFVLPAQDIRTQIPALSMRFRDAPYLTFGWGDEEVYQADDITFWAASIAFTLPTKSVIHVVSQQNPPKTNASTQVATLCLSHANYLSLIHFIEQSFKHNDINQLKPTPLDDGANSQFYYAEGTYYFMNTCNHWTAKGLQSAGFDISPTFKLSADSVMDYLSQDASTQAGLCVERAGK